MTADSTFWSKLGEQRLSARLWRLCYSTWKPSPFHLRCFVPTSSGKAAQRRGFFGWALSPLVVVPLRSGLERLPP